jgi:hypothetical protein
LLESGQVRYKANDSLYPTDKACNCIHALSSIVRGYRPRLVSPVWGEVASEYILRYFQPWIMEPCQHHYGVSSAIGLDSYPIIYREYERRGIARGLVEQYVTGREGTPTYGPPH